MPKKTVRILVDLPIDGANYMPNDVVSFEDATAETLEKSGVVDSSKAAVDYCRKSLDKKVITHEAATAENQAAAEVAAK
ncbi:MAG: hypothetical protein H6R14_777 [Proteobacteria bacterium]|nr:hypothetical protein [Pseudomonadota bacterium]